MGNTVAPPNPNYVNGILKNATIAVSLKYSSNFWRSREILLIDCKVELKTEWTKHWVFSASGTKNDIDDNDNANNNIFNIKDTKLYVPLVILPARDNQKLSKHLSKGSERSFYWNEFKAKRKNKIQQMKVDIFSNKTLLVSIYYLF